MRPQRTRSTSLAAVALLAHCAGASPALLAHPRPSAVSRAAAPAGAAPAPVSAISISLSSPQADLVAGASIRVSFSAQLSDAANASAARLVPYFDGAQFGAEVGFSSFVGGVASGSAFVPLST